MTWRTRAILLGYPLLELVTIYLVAQAIGWGWTLLLLVVGFPVGLGIMRNAASAAMAEVQRAAATGVQPEEQGRHASTMLGGLLIAVPGFWTDLIGLVLVIPFSQRLVRARVGAWASARMSRVPGMRYPGNAGTDVIQGTVIRVADDEGPAQPEPPRPLTPG